MGWDKEGRGDADALCAQTSLIMPQAGLFLEDCYGSGRRDGINELIHGGEKRILQNYGENCYDRNSAEIINLALD